MLKYFTKFDTQAEYDEAKFELDYPNVSIVASALTYTETKPIQPQYRTVTTATTCVGYDLYTLEEYQVSYDGGTTWATTASSATTLIESDSQSCGYVPPTPTFNGKWIATYSDSHTESAECDSSSAITQYEIDATNLVSVEISDCVTSIGEYAFMDCSSITSVTIGSGVTTIGEYAFMDCDGLTSVTIGDCVTEIGFYAFEFCGSLTSVTIGSGVTSIGDSAFAGCNSLTSVTIQAATPPTLGEYVFYNNNCPIYVLEASLSAFKSASGWSDYADRIQPIP